MSQKPLSCRRSVSRFVCDTSDNNVMQVIPPIHASYSSYPSTLTNHSSNTNFIDNSGSSLLKTPRTIGVTESGEKYVIQLHNGDNDDDDDADDDDDDVKSTTTHSFFSSPLPKICEQSSSHLLLSGTEKSITKQCDYNQSSRKLNKISKKARHDAKHRLTVRPQCIKKSSRTRLLGQKNIPKLKRLPIQSRNITNAKTQTSYYALYMPSSSMQVYTKTDGNLKKYSELRGFVSALIFITLIWWLLSTYFDLENLSAYFSIFLEHFQNLYSVKEKPKTKVEQLVQFVQDLWS